VNFARRTFTEHAKQGKTLSAFSFKGQTPCQCPNRSRCQTSTPQGSNPAWHCFDDFLPEDIYQQLYHHACIAEYEHINTTGRSSAPGGSAMVPPAQHLDPFLLR